MPPKKDTKEKEKPIKGDEAEELILDYMKSVNRPYSSTDVSTNLKGKVPKALAQKIMATLAEKGSLTVKPYGKQTIFVYNQALLNVASGDQLGELEQELKDVQREVEQCRKELKEASADAAAKLELPRTKDIQAEIDKIKAHNAETVKALLPFRGDDPNAPKVEPLSDADIKVIDQKFTKWRKEWVDRRKVYKELMGMLEDGGAVVNKASFEDDEGINGDDEEAQEIENGEFVKIVAPIRHPAKRVNSVKPAGVAAKRPAPTSAGEESKKKAKKAKAAE